MESRHYTLSVITATSDEPDMNFVWKATYDPQSNEVALSVKCGQGTIAEHNSEILYPWKICLQPENSKPFKWNPDPYFSVEGNVTPHSTENGYLLTFDGSMIRKGSNNITTFRHNGYIILAAELH